MTELMKELVHDLNYRICKIYPAESQLFASMCSLIMRLYDNENNLRLFCRLVNLCLNRGIDPFQALNAVAQAVELANAEKLQIENGLKKTASKHHQVYDQKIEYSLIYQKHICLNCSVDNLLRDYYNRLHSYNFEIKRFNAMRRQYYRFVSEFYPENVVADVRQQLKTPALKMIAGYPGFGAVNEIVDISRNIPTKHIFYLWDNENIATLVYSKSLKKYYLCMGAAIKCNLKDSAKLYQKTLDRLKEEKLIGEIHGDSEHYQLLKTIEVSSSSHAASLVTGCNISGRVAWVNRFGNTLKDVLKEAQTDEEHQQKQRNKNRRNKRKKDTEAKSVPASE